MDAKIPQGQCTLAGGTTAYTGTLSVGVTAYVDGGLYSFYVNATNTSTTPTININSIGAITVVRADGSACIVGDLKIDTWIQCIYKTSTGFFHLLNPAIASLTAVSNTLFVHKGGVDATAVVGRLDRAYLTITAAQTAASSGDTIIIYPGTYTDTLLGKAGINYHFLNGAILSTDTANAFRNAGSLSYTVTGDGEFVTTSGIVLSSTSAGTISFTAKKITTESTACLVNSTTIVYLKVKDSITGSACSVLGSATLYLDCPVIEGGSVTSVASNSSATATLYLNSEKITSSYAAHGFSLIGTNHIRGNITYTGTGKMVIFDAGATDTTFYGNMNATAADEAVYANAATTGSIDFYGKITGIGNIVINGASLTAEFTFHNSIVITRDEGAIVQETGTVRIKSKVQNLDAAAGAYGINVSNLSGTCIIENATIVTDTAASITAGSALFVLALGTNMANVDKHANITLLAGTLIIDSNVQ